MLRKELIWERDKEWVEKRKECRSNKQRIQSNRTDALFNHSDSTESGQISAVYGSLSYPSFGGGGEPHPLQFRLFPCETAEHASVRRSAPQADTSLSSPKTPLPTPFYDSHKDQSTGPLLWLGQPGSTNRRCVRVTETSTTSDLAEGRASWGIFNFFGLNELPLWLHEAEAYSRGHTPAKPSTGGLNQDEDNQD